MDKRAFLRSKPAICILLCIVALLSVLGISLCYTNAQAQDVYACSYDKQGNVINYYSIGDAIRDGYNGATIIMMKDWNCDETLTIDEKKTITIDMNGHKLTSDAGSVVYLDDGSNLTLTSSTTKWFNYTAYGDTAGGQTKSSIETGGLITGADTTDKAGGVVMRDNTTLTLDNVSIAGNASDYAGGISVLENCTINMKQCAEISHNKGSKFAGGIYFEYEDCQLNMDNSYINANYCGKSGGGIYSNADGTRISMENNSTISYNRAKEYGGGAYFNYSYFSITSKDKTASISNNIAENDHGGGVYIQYKRWATNEGKIEGCTIAGNSCRLDGGGIFAYQNWTRIIDCTLTGNSARKGGGAYILGSDDSIEGCTITENTCWSDYEGGGIYVHYSTDIKLTGVCIIKDNTRGENGSADDAFLDDGAVITHGVDEGSKVGVRTDHEDDCRIGKNISTYTNGSYFIDLAGYYVSHGTDEGGDLWQRHKTLQFLAQVNGEGSSRYSYNSSVSLDGTPSDASKAFWYWDADATTGLYPVADFITSKNKYSSPLTFKMPQNDVNLSAVYADRVKSGLMSLTQPVAGQELPNTVSFKRTDSGSGWSGELTDIPVTWYEVDSSGTKTIASGTAKYGVTYVASVSISQNQQDGRFFSKDITGQDIIVRVNSEAGTTDTKAQSTTVDEGGTLTIETNTFVMPKPEIEKIAEAKHSVLSGTTKADLLSSLPDEATVTLNDGSTVVLATDKTKEITWPSDLFDENDKVVDPGTTPAGYKILLPLADTDKVASVTGKYLEVGLTVLPKDSVAEPVLTPIGGTYNKYTGDVRVDENLQLKVTATCSTEGATIKYRLGEKADEYVYNSDTGIVFTGVKDEQELCEVTVWAEKTVVDPDTKEEKTVKSTELQEFYTIDDMLKKTIDISCSDTAYYEQGEKHWSSSFDVTADIHGKVNITAPDQAGRVFDHWEWEDKPDTETADLTQKTLEIKDFSVKYAGKITAVYTPVVSTLDIGVTEPTAHVALSKNASYLKAAVGDSTEMKDITAYFTDKAAITWSPEGDADGNAEHLSWYTASLKLDADSSISGAKYIISDGLKLLVDGKDVAGAAHIVEGEDASKMLYIEFPQTGSYVYSSLANIDDVSLSFEEAYGYQVSQDADKSVSWGLPKEVLTRYKCGESGFADIEWEKVTGFDKTKLEAQELTVTGTVKYSSNVDSTGAPETVMAKIKVSAPESVATPSASPEPGTYKEAQTVVLSCDTQGASIRYTTDGSEPSTKSALYRDAIQVSSDTVIKACAFRDGMATSEVATFTYKIDPDAKPMEKVATPTASPEAGTYDKAQSVTLSSATEGATIYYTTDGTEPTQASTKYTGAIDVKSSTTIKARAFNEGMSESDVATFDYTIKIEPVPGETVAKPMASAESGMYKQAQSVKLGTLTEGSTIYYTTDGTDPTESSTKYTGDAIEVNSFTILKTRAYHDDMTPSDIAFFAYAIEPAQVETCIVTFDSAGGSTVNAQGITKGSKVEKPADPTRDGYTFDGWYMGDATYDFDTAVTGNVTLVAHWTENPKPEVIQSPVASVEPGVYKQAQKVELYCSTEGATIRYTTDNSEPTEASPEYTGAIDVSSSMVIKARVYKESANASADGALSVSADGASANGADGTSAGTNATDGASASSSASEVAKFVYAIEPAQVETCIVTFDSAGGSVVKAQGVTKGGKVEKPADPTRTGYTFDGWFLGDTAYNFDTAVTGEMTLTAHWTEDAKPETVAKPTASVDPGVYKQAQKVALSCATEGATIRYTADNSEPIESSPEYTEALDITTSTTVKARAFHEGMTASESTTLVYAIETTPVETYVVSFDSAGGTGVKAQSVTKGSKVEKPADPTRDGYTFDGWYLGDTAYNFDAEVTGEMTLTAHWIENAKPETVAKPTASVETGVYTQAQSVELTSSTEGATIYYTTDGSDPTENSTKYTGAINVDSFTMLKARAFHDGMTASDVATYAYAIQSTPVEAYVVSFDSAGGTGVKAQSVTKGSKVEKPADPTREGYTFDGWFLGDTAYNFDAEVTGEMTLTAHWIENAKPETVAKPTASVETGVYTQAQSVELTSSTEGATIYYTTDGSDPTENSTKYTGAINVDSFTMLKARAFHDGMTASDVSTYAYAIQSTPVEAYVVSFDSAGGTGVKAQSVTKGSKVEKPADPTREGYTFDGWFLGDTAYNFDAEVTGEMTLTAHWTKDSVDPSGGGSGDKSGDDKATPSDGSGSTNSNSATSDDKNSNKDALANTADEMPVTGAFALAGGAIATLLTAGVALRRRNKQNI